MVAEKTLSTFVNRAIKACELTESESITVMMQMSDTDKRAFRGVLRTDDDDPFTDDNVILQKITAANNVMRSLKPAEDLASEAMQEISGEVKNANGYLRVRSDGEVKLYVHYSMGGSTLIVRTTIREPDVDGLTMD